MKKVYLLSLAAAFGFSATAQLSNPKTGIDFNPKQTLEVNKKASLHTTEPRVSGNKGTAIVNREYNIVDMRFRLNSTIVDNNTAPYMWFDDKGKAIFQGTAGLELDTIYLGSYMSVLHPWYATFNDANVYPGEPKMTIFKAYTLDSVYVTGIYGRNAAKPNVVDTLIIASTFGGGTNTNIPIFYYAPNTSHADTIYTAIPYWTPQRNTITDSVGGLGNVTVRKILLNANSVNDTDANGWNVFRAAVNMAVPAGRLVSSSVTFRSGDASYVTGDTVYAGSATPTRPFKYGNFRPSFYEVTDGAYPTYYKNPRDYNSAGVAIWPVSANYPDSYIPLWAFTPPFSLEFPDMSFVLKFNDTINSNGIASAANKLESKAYPNPSNDVLNIEFSLKSSANVQLNVTNAAGQIVAVQNLGQRSAGTTQKVTVMTNNLPAGVYFYNITAGEMKATERFVVTH